MILFYALFTSILVVLLMAEYLFLSRAVLSIPVRILVNGTRGKTTTVKILHEIFRTAGWNVCSKTTGDEPLLHFPDGTERTLKRPGPGNIRENIFLLHRWSRKKVQAVIMEDMALMPETQQILTRRIFRPTHFLLTNIITDHLEQMGNDKTEILETFLQSFPQDAPIYLPENLLKGIDTHDDSHFNLQPVKPFPHAPVFANIPGDIIAHNYSLITDITAALGIDSSLVENTFRETWTRVSNSIEISRPEKNFSLFNLFSVNDPESTLKMILHLRAARIEFTVEIFLINTRRDRPLRSLQFIDMLIENFPGREIWVGGSGRSFFNYRYRRTNNNELIRVFPDVMTMADRFKTGFDERTAVYGCGNHKGIQQFLEQIGRKE